MNDRDPRLFDEWFSLWLVDPWGPERDDYRIAALAAQMPDTSPKDVPYPVDLKDFVRAKEAAELVGDPDSPALHREQARLAAGRKTDS